MSKRLLQPFRYRNGWRSDAEIDATPMRVLRYVEMEAETWGRLCG